VLLQQADINDKMRAILIDWLVEVHLKFKVGRHECQHQRRWLQCELVCHMVTGSNNGRLTQC
jgi:Cyclin, N-terminal domain